ncbi:MAG TPA: wax ester/triacylglycerol synthase family O-acyltransferase [Solirubrobacterales bacterium]
MSAPNELSALDATFLELEQADPSAHMHIGGILCFEPRPSGATPSVAEVAEVLGSRLSGLPRYRQRLSEQTTGGLDWPRWDDDPRFEISRHIRRAQLPGRGTRDDLLEWAGEYFSERLDRSRPLWELVVISGLEGGAWAMASKTHHCLVDGVGSVDTVHLMLDAEPEPVPRDVHAAPAEGAPRPQRGRELPGSAILRLPARAAAAGIGLLRAGAGTATHPSRAREALQRSRALVDVLVRDEVIAAPRTSINEPIGGRRRLAVLEIELEELKRIKRALGGTINDVVLAAAGGGFRELLIARGEELPRQGMRAMVPVNIRSAGEHLGLGNRITSLFVNLPLAEPDPERRYAQQLEEAETLKSGDQALGASAILDLTGHAPPVIHGFIARSLFATRMFNVTITNVPGPQQPLYAFGSKLLSVWPLVPLAAEHSIGIAIFSYDGRAFFAVNADRDSVPDLDLFVDAIGTSILQLSHAAGATAG